jgi:hypothetical protein
MVMGGALAGGVVGYIVAKNTGNGKTELIVQPATPASNMEEMKRKALIAYGSVTISLATARTGINSEAMDILGDFISVRTLVGSAQIILNEPENTPIPLTANMKIRTPFYRFFIVNTAQPLGTVTMDIGRNNMFEVGFEVPQIDAATALRLSQYTRWGRVINPSWIHAVEVVAPLAGATLVTKAVTAAMSGYIYGFFISSGEANNFLINWTSGGVAKSKRIVFSALGSVEAIDTVPLNEGLPADAGTNVTITNVTAGGAGVIYQATLLYGEV